MKPLTICIVRTAALMQFHPRRMSALTCDFVLKNDIFAKKVLAIDCMLELY